MFEQVGALVGRYQELGRELNDPQTIADQPLWQKIMKEHAELTPIVETYTLYQQARKNEKDNLLFLQEEPDPQLRQLAKEELADCRGQIEKLEEKMKVLLTPKDPNDEKNVFVEIRAGAGGDEAALFASDLYRMYSRYAERKGWKASLVSVNENGLG